MNVKLTFYVKSLFLFAREREHAQAEREGERIPRGRPTRRIQSCAHHIIIHRVDILTRRCRPCRLELSATRGKHIFITQFS